ncbi:transposase, partial [Microlunatus sp. GCM10028923]|uniref:transposase n=1 Tax=Microlunatus sp. GCM10028923 TaxID=3273400 RepID=UPI00360DF02A
TSGHLAAYAGLAPVTRRSGTSIRGEHPARSGNKHLKRAFFLSTFAALRDPASRAYYDRKRAEGKKHNAALICLARRRCDVLVPVTGRSTAARDIPRGPGHRRPSN